MKLRYLMAITIVCGLTSLISQAQTLDHKASFQLRAYMWQDAPVIDTQGNMYFTGSTTHWGPPVLDLDPGSGVYSIDSTGPNDFYAMSWDSLGSIRWVRTFGSPGSEITAEVLRHFGDTEGNTYLVGRFSDTLLIDGFTLIAHGSVLDLTSSVFLIKLNNAGNVIWANQYGTSDISFPGNSCLSADGESIYLTYRPNYTSANATNIVIARIDTSGNLIWSKTLVGTAGNFDTQVQGITTDNLGNLIFSGYALPAIDYDGGPSTFSINPGSNAAYFCKWSQDGDLIWVKTIRSSDNMLPYPTFLNIHTDSENALYFLGLASGITDINPGAAIQNVGTAGFFTSFIIKLNSSGIFLWGREFDSVPPTAPTFSLLIDGNNNVLIGGQTNVGADLDPGVGIQTGINGYYILKLNTEGDFMWAKQCEGSANSFPSVGGLSIDPQKRYIYSITRFNGQVNPISGLTFDAAPDNASVLVSKWEDAMCSDFGVRVDSVNVITCLDPASGRAWARTIGGEAPFSYTWSGGTTLNDSTAIFTEGGFYTVTAGDSRGCNRSSTVLVAAPDTSINVPDLKVMVANNVWALRPAQQFETYVDLVNKSCEPVSGTVYLVHDYISIFESATPAPDNIHGDTLIWNFMDLTLDNSPFHVVIKFVADSTLADSLFASGQEFCMLAYVTPSEDFNSSDNSMFRCNSLVNSYDPNDIQVFPSGECGPGYVHRDEVLTYTIRFQNTGSTEAINIQILDTIPSALDISTLRLIGQSHIGLVTEIHSGNKVNFRFDNIHLPDSSSNEIDSRGYLHYEIRAYSSIASGTIVNNRAAIYFDFNDPVITNTASITLVDDVPALDRTVSQTGNVLSANGNGYSYQWIDCGNGNSEIEGAVLQHFNVTQTGQYAVIVSFNGCSDFSDCIPVVILNTDKIDMVDFSIYPNPSTGSFFLSSATLIKAHGIDVFDVSGRLVESFSNITNGQAYTPNISSGMYFIRIVDVQGNAIKTMPWAKN
jgi:hypothetical protein